MNSKNLLLAFLLFITSTSLFAQTSTTQDLSYLLERKEFKTNLLHKGKAPQPFEEFDEKREDIMLVNYESDGKKLKGLVETSNIEKDKKKPILVYLHGGFALGYEDVSDCKPFTDAGFVVFAPSYRGENGNDGNFEMFFGEVDDAKAAINWISKQEYANADSIFVFGHSIGGAISSLLSLHIDVPINLSASNAGFYNLGDLENFEKEGIKTFDYSNELELLFRFPYSSLQYMQRKHIVYMGEDDNFDYWNDRITKYYEKEKLTTLLEMKGVKGNHFTSLKPSMKLFIEKIRINVENETKNKENLSVKITEKDLENHQSYEKGMQLYEEKNYKEAFSHFEKAAEKGHQASQYNLGWIYREGLGVEKSIEKSLYWYKESAKQGNATAQFNVAWIYFKGNEIKVNYDEAFKWSKLAVEQNLSEAQYLLGILYQEGKGTKQDYNEANRLFGLAANQGNIEAVFKLGWAYQNGLGVKVDYAKAAKEYKKILKDNHLGAMGNLSILYLQGLGVEKNKQEAFKLMNKAHKTDPSIPDFAYRLGCMYMNGDGVERNPDTAISLMQKAARQGFKPAQEHLTDIKRTW